MTLVGVDPLADVAVVVVTYRSAPLVPQLLGSLPVGRLAGVVVVDNASDDDTVEQVRARLRPGITLLPHAQNVGFGAGCNAGFERMPPRARLVLFLNPDAALTPEHLERLVEHLRLHPKCAVVAPRLYRNGEALSSAGRIATLVTELRYVLPVRLANLLPERRHGADYDVDGPVGVVEGAVMLFRVDAFREVGRFDARYFLFFEEHDMARRLAMAGHTMDLCTRASATHLVGSSREATPLAGRQHYFTSTVRYLRRWQGRRAARTYRFAACSHWRLQARRGALPLEDAELLINAVRSA